MLSRILLPLIAGVALFAQDPDTPAPPPSPPDLKTFLNLGDNQIQAIAILQAQQSQAIQPLAQQMAQLQQKLKQLLGAQSPDPAAIGQQVLMITALSQQIQEALHTFQQQRVGVLNGEQASRLPALLQALVLQEAAIQAATLGLIPRPPTGSQ